MTDNIMEPAPIAAPVWTPTPGATSKNAVDLVTYLRQSGTPPATLARFQSFLMENPDATADRLYQALIDAEVTLGTIRKAGKWIWGAGFEPLQESATFAAMGGLAAENQALRESLEAANSERLSLTKQLAHERARNAEQTAELMRLRMRQTAG
jgi:hypothetical protein